MFVCVSAEAEAKIALSAAEGQEAGRKKETEAVPAERQLELTGIQIWRRRDSEAVESMADEGDGEAEGGDRARRTATMACRSTTVDDAEGFDVAAGLSVVLFGRSPDKLAAVAAEVTARRQEIGRAHV